jgi:hypothetical protein
MQRFGHSKNTLKASFLLSIKENSMNLHLLHDSMVKIK